MASKLRPSEPDCHLEIQVLGFRLKAVGPLAVGVAAVAFLAWLFTSKLL